jgi:Bacteriocin-protection, YdeI or OmpD-Associated/Domain of unknown function (DUF1905)
MNIIEFDAVITKSDESGAGAFVFFPYDVEKIFGTRGQVKVQCEFEGVPYRGSIVNMGAGPCIGILKAIREKLGKQVGDKVHVRLWKDEAPRVVEIPEDLEAALKNSPQSQELFEKLSYSHKREYVQWITDAKREETRTRRVEKTMEMLISGIKTPKA